MLLVTDHPDQSRSITQQSMVETCLWFCEGWSDTFEDETIPRCCMFTYIWLIFVVNVGKYTRHGYMGIESRGHFCRFTQPTFVCTRWSVYGFYHGIYHHFALPFGRIYYEYIPGTQMTSIFEGHPPKTRPFPIKTRVIWVQGIYIYMFFKLPNIN